MFMINEQIIKNSITYKFYNRLYEEILDWLDTIGYIGINLYYCYKLILRGNVDLKSTIQQASRFGVDSLPLSLTIVGLSGMIIALQVAQEMVKQGAGDYVGTLVTMAIIREIGPIMASFAVISMVGSSMAAEVASMKVTEQIDAMKTLKVNPIEYLIVPRTLAGFMIMPFVVIIGNAVGILGGMFTSSIISGLNTLTYIESVWRGLNMTDIWVSILKGCVFGGIISLMSTSIGYKTEGGAKDVGIATTKAVVWSFTTVVVIDYVISLMFLK
jgi:phospholipid/cholesterol/gamma-HCH transport system permease protein